jgi:hypothetical protein
MSDATRYTTAQCQTNLWQLRGFARTGFPTHNHNLMVTNGACQIIAFGHHRQVGGEFDHG